jgi:uncharacterized protein
LRSHDITVVFDGIHSPPFSTRADRIRGVEIRFSKEGETADAVIMRMVARERENILVVSSDRELVRFAENKGAVAISSPDFEARMVMAAFGMTGGGGVEESPESGWIPTTRKKGPVRRRSKKERRSRRKIEQL